MRASLRKRKPAFQFVLLYADSDRFAIRRTDTILVNRVKRIGMRTLHLSVDTNLDTVSVAFHVCLVHKSDILRIRSLSVLIIYFVSHDTYVITNIYLRTQ